MRTGRLLLWWCACWGSYLWTAHAHWQAAAVVVWLGSYLWTAHAHWQAAAAVTVGGEGQDGGPAGQDAPLLPQPTASDPLVPPPGQKFVFI